MSDSFVWDWGNSLEDYDANSLIEVPQLDSTQSTVHTTSTSDLQSEPSTFPSEVSETLNPRLLSNTTKARPPSTSIEPDHDSNLQYEMDSGQIVPFRDLHSQAARVGNPNLSFLPQSPSKSTMVSGTLGNSIQLQCQTRTGGSSYNSIISTGIGLAVANDRVEEIQRPGHHVWDSQFSSSAFSNSYGGEVQLHPATKRALSGPRDIDESTYEPLASISHASRRSRDSVKRSGHRVTAKGHGSLMGALEPRSSVVRQTPAAFSRERKRRRFMGAASQFLDYNHPNVVQTPDLLLALSGFANEAIDDSAHEVERRLLKKLHRKSQGRSMDESTHGTKSRGSELLQTSRRYAQPNGQLTTIASVQKAREAAIEELPTSTSNAHECSGCRRVFSRKGDLKRHAKIHGSPEWPCKFCSKALSRKDKLKEHITKNHKDVTSEEVLQYLNEMDWKVKRPKPRSYAYTPDLERGVPSLGPKMSTPRHESPLRIRAFEPSFQRPLDEFPSDVGSESSESDTTHTSHDSSSDDGDEDEDASGGGAGTLGQGNVGGNLTIPKFSFSSEGRNDQNAASGYSCSTFGFRYQQARLASKTSAPSSLSVFFDNLLPQNLKFLSPLSVNVRRRDDHKTRLKTEVQISREGFSGLHRPQNLGKTIMRPPIAVQPSDRDSRETTSQNSTYLLQGIGEGTFSTAQRSLIASVEPYCVTDIHQEYSRTLSSVTVENNQTASAPVLPQGHDISKPARNVSSLAATTPWTQFRSAISSAVDSSVVLFAPEPGPVFQTYYADTTSPKCGFVHHEGHHDSSTDSECSSSSNVESSVTDGELLWPIKDSVPQGIVSPSDVKTVETSMTTSAPSPKLCQSHILETPASDSLNFCKSLAIAAEKDRCPPFPDSAAASRIGRPAKLSISGPYRVSSTARRCVISNLGRRDAKEKLLGGSHLRRCFIEKYRSTWTTCPHCCDILNKLQLSYGGNLVTRFPLLLPGVLTSHLKEEKLLAFFRQHVSLVMPHSFDIPLTIGFGADFVFEMRQFVPIDRIDNLDYYMGVIVNATSGTSQLSPFTAPSITPYLITPSEMASKIGSWLDDILDSRLGKWPDYCSVGESSTFVRDVLGAVCQFYKDGGLPGTEKATPFGPSVVLRQALKLHILIWLMSHQLIIPEHAKASLELELDYRFPDGPVSPRLPNKVIKGLIVPKLKALSKSTIKGFEILIQRGDLAGWTYGFCVILLLLTVTAEVQISLTDLVLCAAEKGDSFDIYSRSNTSLEKLEEDLAQVLISLFHTQLRTRFGNSPTPFLDESVDPRASALFMAVFMAHETHGLPPLQCSNFAELSPDQYASMNVSRLLSTFLGFFAYHHEKPSPSPSETESEKETAFIYQPLNDSEFRLFELLPGQVSEPIQGTISHTSFASAPNYAAISYTWGDPKPQRLVYIDSRGLFVGPNLYAALHHLRAENARRLIWVDSICINQSDHSERQSQIRMMACIYSRATQVIVWLGDETEHSAFGMDILRSVLWLGEETEHGAMEMDFLRGRALDDSSQRIMPWRGAEAVRAGVQDLLQRPWFRRRWVVQEIALAKKVTVFCGRHAFEWPTRMEQIRVSESNLEELLSMFPLFVETEFHIIQNFFLILSRLKSTKRLRLHTLVHEMRNWECSDPRDTVYALLGLAAEQDAKNNSADYSLSLKRVYQRLARTCLESKEHSSNSLEKWRDLPSWAPVFCFFIDGLDDV